MNLLQTLTLRATIGKELHSSLKKTIIFKTLKPTLRATPNSSYPIQSKRIVVR